MVVKIDVVTPSSEKHEDTSSVPVAAVANKTPETQSHVVAEPEKEEPNAKADETTEDSEITKDSEFEQETREEPAQTVKFQEPVEQSKEESTTEVAVPAVKESVPPGPEETTNTTETAHPDLRFNCTFFTSLYEEALKLLAAAKPSVKAAQTEVQLGIQSVLSSVMEFGSDGTVEFNSHIHQECDFESPTLVYTLIQQRDWVGAMRRLDENPAEATIWVSRKDKQTGQLRWRVLPLHAAIIFHAPDKVVRKLIEVYPQSAACKDDQGKLPVHLSYHLGSSAAAAVDTLIDAYPKGLEIKDNKGRTPARLAQPFRPAVSMSTSQQDSTDTEARLQEAQKEHERELGSIKEQAAKEKDELRVMVTKLKAELVVKDKEYKEMEAKLKQVSTLAHCNDSEPVQENVDELEEKKSAMEDALADCEKASA